MIKSMIKNNRVKKAERVLKKNGYSYIEINKDEVVFEGDHYMTIEVDELLDCKSSRDIENKSEWYSCCGDVLDKDTPLCPTCKEWC